jgi:hypothetical protein
MKHIYNFLRRISTAIRGNVKVLSGAIVVGICVAVTLFLVKPDLNLLAGALIGAAVSIVAAALIEFLQAPGGRRIPDQFIAGAQREVDMVGYYRDSQEVHIELIASGTEKKIRMIFNSRLVPIPGNDVRPVYPKIKAPPGYTSTDPIYKIGGDVISPDSQPHITSPSEECLIVEYKVPDQLSEYSDAHIWKSPVLRYDVYFMVPKDFECSVFEQIGEDNVPVKHSRRLGLAEKHFPQPFPTFSRQGFTWRIKKL